MKSPFQLLHFVKFTLTTLLGLASLSCGAGSAAIAGGGGGGGAGGDVDAPAVVTAVTLSAKTSPATIGFTLTDADGGPLPVIDLLYARTGQASKPMTQAVLNGPLTLGANSFAWDFALEGDLGNGEFIDGVGIQVQVRGGTSVLTPGALIDGSLQNSVAGSRVGNDAPAVMSFDFGSASELSGNVDVGIELSDSSNDFVDVVLEYKLASEPDSAFRPARSTSIPADLPAEAVALTSVQATSGGSTFVFRWESEYVAAIGLPMTESQLPGLEVDVELRATPRDSVVSGSGLRAMLRIDNNVPPQAVLSGDLFAFGIKDRGRIPVPLQLFDAESDTLDVLLQWARDTQPFPDLPTKVDDLRDLMRNPARAAERKQLQLAVEAPLAFSGRVGVLAQPLAANQIRLPEIASTAAGLLAHGIEGRTLEILRPTTLEPAPWGSGPGPFTLNSPVAAVFHVDGLSALVLDRSVAGLGSRIVKFDIETGASDPELFAEANGFPKVLSLDPSGTRLFLATVAELRRFDSVTGTQLGKPVPLPVGIDVRGIAAMGSDIVVATTDTRLVRIDFKTSEIVTLVSGLAEPFGVVADPLAEGSVYVAERTKNRIVAIDLDKGVPVPVSATTDPDDSLVGGAFPSPRAVALEKRGAGLLVLCQVGASTSLRSLDLRSPIDFDGAMGGQADPFVREIPFATALNDLEAGMATGPDRSRVIASFEDNRLFFGGGVSQRRQIDSDPNVAYDKLTQVVQLSSPLEVSSPTLWRIQVPMSGASDPLGRAQTFLWDTAEVPDPLQVRLRILPIDGDLGVATTGGKPFRPSFDESAALPTGSVPTSMAAADLDGDGDLDLVSANETSSTLTLFFQSAPGVFTPDATPLSTGSDPRCVAAADLDGDGDLDLVSANSGPSTLTLFFQGSPGVFTPGATPLPTGSSPVSVAAADLDGDGDLDLVSANSTSSTLTLFFQGAPGTFTPGATSLPTGSSPVSVAAADLDGDGDLDLVSANFFSSTLTLFFQGAPGVFTPGASPLPTGSFAYYVAAADLDGDGDLDLVSTNFFSSTLTLFFQGAPGEFEPSATPLPTGSPPYSVVAADLDGDGDLDLVSANSGSSTLTLFFQGAPGEFVPSATPLPTGSPPYSVVAADLDGDGDLDLVSANGGSGTLNLFIQGAPGIFTPGATPLPTGPIPGSVAAADLDGDGDLDLVSSNRGSGTLTLFFQGAPGVFTPGATKLSTGNDPSSVAAADLDGDGNLDLVSANRGSDTLTLFFQGASGVFTPGATPLSTGIDPRSVAAADLDGDGDHDLVSANGGFGTLTLFFQDAPGVFTPGATSLSTGSEPGSVAAADLDSDGDLDLVSANGGSDTLTLFFQGAPGDFAPSATPLPTGSSPLFVASADLDGDGDLDLVSANFFSSTLTLFFQGESGDFTPGSNLLSTDVAPRSVAAADLDGDGDLDLVAANEGSSTLTLFFQSEPGDFTPGANPLLTGSGPRSVAAADLDGDGDYDLVSANEDSETLTLFFGGQ